MALLATSPQDVLDFWLADGLRHDWPTTAMSATWFGGGADLDALITQRFGPLVHTALAHGLPDWEQPLLHRLALVILLDQFTRNVFRGQAQAFAGDGRAQRLVLQSLALEQDQELPRVGRVFFYLPLMHAESSVLQDESVMKFTELRDQAPATLQDTLSGHVHHAEQHRDIVRRFGRFPHRNAAMGRTSTPDEIAFLRDGPRFGQ